MLNINKKVITTTIIVCLLGLFTSSTVSAYPANLLIQPQASELIQSTYIDVVPDVKGKLTVTARLKATQRVQKLGVKSIEIQTMKNGYWQSIKTLAKNDYAHNTASYNIDCAYYGTRGKRYRAYVKFYIEDGDKSETKSAISSPVTAE